MSGKGKDIPIGTKYNMLTILRRLPSVKGEGGGKVEVLCDCGNVKKMTLARIEQNSSKSCGCAAKTKIALGKGSQTREYRAWTNMKQRCTNVNRADYVRYGGRGISICARWTEYQPFLADMGKCPPKYQLDRVNNNGNYEPSNCRWVSNYENSINKRTNVYVFIGGCKMHLKKACEIVGVSNQSVCSKVTHTGSTHEEAILYLIEHGFSKTTRLAKQ